MAPVLTRHAPGPVTRIRSVAVPLVTLVVSVLLFAAVLRLVEPQATVDAVTIRNRTGFHVDVGVTDGSSRDRLLLAGLDPESSTRIEDVLDQGSTWRFRVDRAGSSVGTIDRTRDRLRADGWQVVVPASWDDRVREAANG